MPLALPILVLVVAYLLGSIPFSFLVVRQFTGTDLRKQGSGNIGATNVARISGKLPGLLALLLDMTKGYAAVAVARWATSRPGWPFAATADASPIHSAAFWIAPSGLVAVLAHMFPVWLRFHGGKGVATGAGAFLGIDPIALAAGIIVFLIVLVATRFASLASMVSSASLPIFLRFLTHKSFWTIVIGVVIATIIILKHHANIARLAQRRERRFGEDEDRS